MICRLYKEIFLKRSYWGIAVLQCCAAIQQRQLHIYIYLYIYIYIYIYIDIYIYISPLFFRFISQLDLHRPLNRVPTIFLKIHFLFNYCLPCFLSVSPNFVLYVLTFFFLQLRQQRDYLLYMYYIW